VPKSLQTYRNQTFALIVHTSTGGTKVRIKISNAYGDGPLLIGGAHIARRTADGGDRSALRPDAEVSSEIVHDGHCGSMVVSDPVELDVPALSDLRSAFFFLSALRPRRHTVWRSNHYVVTETGDSTDAVKFPVAKSIHSWPFPDRRRCRGFAGCSSHVAFGSSLTDGDEP